MAAVPVMVAAAVDVAALVVVPPMKSQLVTAVIFLDFPQVQHFVG